MSSLMDEVHGRLHALADRLENEADEFQLVNDCETAEGHEIPAARAAGACSVLRAVVGAIRDSAPGTEDHEFDCSIADLVDLEAVPA